jgi:hypothetical protein
MASICTYLPGVLHVSVAFGRGRADTFEIEPGRLANGRPDTRYLRVDLKRFLKGRLPPGSRQESCRHLTKSNEGGPADACLYRWHGKRLIVVRYLRPPAYAPKGRTDYSVFGFGDVAPNPR